MTYDYDKLCIETFYKNQTKLIPEYAALQMDEVADFLEDCMAVVCKDMKEVKAYLKEAGADIAGLSMKELEELEEVFSIPDGRYLVVEA